jgi:hypothetical protein
MCIGNFFTTIYARRPTILLIMYAKESPMRNR